MRYVLRFAINPRELQPKDFREMGAQGLTPDDVREITGFAAHSACSTRSSRRWPTRRCATSERRRSDVNCPACGQDLRPGARFCDGCGAAVEARCPACGKGQRPQARFCDACGTPLGAAGPRPHPVAPAVVRAPPPPTRRATSPSAS